MNHPRFDILYLFCLFTFILFGCSDNSASSAKHPNILLISIDTLRSDHLSCYGYSKPTSPNIDKIASTGVRFDNVMSVSSWTLPSHASMLTGKYPPSHGLQDDGVKLYAKIPTVAQILKKEKYYSIGVISHVYVSNAFELGKGFDVFDDSLIQGGAVNPIAEQVVDNFLKHAQHIGNKRYFAFIHFFDPHWDYVPPAPFNTTFTDPKYKGTIDGTQDSIFSLKKRIKPIPKKDLEQIKGLYDGEIAYVDSQIGRLVDALRSMGLAQNLVIVITSDHGEEFLDHGNFGHGMTLFSEQLSVPLIIGGHAKFVGGTRLNKLVSTCDIAPTIIELAGIIDQNGFDGISLVDPSDLNDRVVFSETIRFGLEKRAAQYGVHKMIHRLQGNQKVYYDLKMDQEEQNPLKNDPSGGVLTNHLLTYYSEVDSGWHFKLISPDRAMRCMAEVSTTGKIVNPRHYFSQNIYGRGINIEKFELDQKKQELIFEFVFKGIGEIIFDTEPFNSPIKLKISAFTKEDSKNPAFIFLGAGDKKIPEGEYIALSRSDSKVRQLPESYYNAHPGVYIRAVNPISKQASKSNLSEKAIERLKTLGYIK